MKPIKLQFKGINSFSEQTQIDFEKLIKNGIFGIFGDTGSGKSTILDCINFALYGKVERSREKLDIINYRSDAAEVKFEFDVLCDGKRKRFSVERSIKKKSGLHKACLYEGGACIADNASTVTKKITDVLGVDAEDFRKCIALPQGEFSQFVKSQPSERIALIERLFSLSRYGDRLKERLKARESQVELNYQTISAKLGLYDGVSQDVIKETEKQLIDGKAQLEILLKESDKAENSYLNLKALSEKRAELDDIVKKLCGLEAEKSRMEELRAGLKAVPFCKTVVETESEKNDKSQRLEELIKLIDEITRQIEIQKQKLNELNSLAENKSYDEQIAACITLSAKYTSCEGKPEKLAALEKALESKRKQYRVKDEELTHFKDCLVLAQKNVKAVESKLEQLSSKNLEELINVDFKGAILKDEYVNSLNYFVGLNGQIKFFKDNSELFKFIERELKQQIEIYKDRVYHVKDFNLEGAQNKLKNLQTADEERKRLTVELNEKTVALKDAETTVNDCLKDLKIIQRDGEELRKQADEIKAELVKVFGNLTDYAAAEKENAENLVRLKNKKAQLASDLETANKKLNEFNAQIAAKQAEKSTLEAEICKLNSKIKTAITQSGFDDIEGCKKLINEFYKYSDAEKALEEYDTKLISSTSRRIELENIDGLSSYSSDKLNAAAEIKNSLSARLSVLREEIAVMQSELKKAKDRLNEKKVLEKELNAAERERNLIAQLKEITKGNKFMEYIANEYLYDISTLASSTLLNLTDGRYFLTYTDTFYVGDNFNCGNLRGVNTLSGGETFLVSLSLALALSQSICSSLKSIEFFFLDEGFGTLDGALVDTVMNALEKLKSSRFTIGVISHVEELKHRIDNKITVNKATESHGSTVQISY